MILADTVVRTTCPYCGVGCQLDLHIRDGMVYRVQCAFDAPPELWQAVRQKGVLATIICGIPTACVLR